MLWALLAAYFLGGGFGGISAGILTPESIKQIRARTEEIITDPVRSEAAQQTLAELQKEVKAFDKLFSKSDKQLNKSYKDHAVGSNHAQLILDELNTAWNVSQQRAIDLRFQLRDSVTEAEWAELYAVTK
jgi:hypothetical protein